MSALRLPVPSEVGGRRRGGCCDVGSGDCSVWRSCGSGGGVYVGGRRRLAGGMGGRVVVAWLGLVCGGEGKSSKGRSLSSVLPPVCGRLGKDVRRSVLQPAARVGVEESSQLDKSGLNRPLGQVEDGNVVVENGRRQKGDRKPPSSRLMGSKRGVKRTDSLLGPVTINKRCRYVRKDSADLEAILSSVGPETSVEHCNSVLKLLEQRSEKKTIAFFDWMRLHGKLDQNTVAYNLVLQAFGRKEDWSSAETLVEEMVSDSGCELDIRVFNSLVYMCAKRGLPKIAARWFQLMLGRGIQPSFAIIGFLMGLYQKTGCLAEAEFTFSQMRRFKLQHVPAYSAMITLYTRLHLYGKSEEIIELMREDNVSPNLENWLVQLNAYCQQGKLEEAELVFKQMRESGFSANIVAYNTLITGYGKASNTEAVQNLFQDLHTVGLKPDETTYRSMVEGYGRRDDYTRAKLFYEEMKHSGFHPSSSNFYTMVNLLARHGDDDGVIQTLGDMRMLGCEHSSILTVFLHAYERVKRMDKVPYLLEGEFYENILLNPTSCSILVLSYVRNSLLDEALIILRNMRWEDSAFLDNLYHTLICSCKEACNYEGAVLIFGQMPKSEDNPNLHIMCTMIDIYCCMNRFHDAEDLYLQLKASGVALDMIAYSIVVRMYVKSGSLKDACLVLDEMDEQKDITPDTYLYRDMLRIYQQCGKLEKLANAYYKMLRNGSLKWDEEMYNCVINCCGRALPVDEISKLFDEMIRQGYAANNFTFNVMLDIYGKAGLLTKARKVFYMARRQGLVDVISYNTMIAAYGQKDIRMMKSMVYQMQNAGYSVSLEAYNCLLDAYGKEDQLEEFNDTLEMMRQSRCPSDHYTYNILINIYGKKGWIEDVASVLAELRKHGLEPDLYGYNTLIQAYGIAGMVEEAVNVVKEMREKNIQPDRVTYINLITALQRNENYLEAVKWSLWMKQVELSS